jgi:hypothetical protein
MNALFPARYNENTLSGSETFAKEAPSTVNKTQWTIEEYQTNASRVLRKATIVKFLMKLIPGRNQLSTTP